MRVRIPSICMYICMHVCMHNYVCIIMYNHIHTYSTVVLCDYLILVVMLSFFRCCKNSTHEMSIYIFSRRK